jgi:DNA-directed RNA polymerase specialized sigma24 family protein
MDAPDRDVTALLHAWTAGDVEARDELLTRVYGELRHRAARQLRRESGDRSLQPTVLIHDVSLDPGVRATPPFDVQVLDLDAALKRLASFDPRKSQLAELRFFGGLSLEEAAEALGISRATAERDWQAARAWLLKEIRGERRRDT